MSNPTVPFYPMTHDDAQELIAAIGDNSKLAAPYDATRTYAVKEHCIYGGNVYRCKIPINTPEQWTPGHWEQITIGDELTENSQGLAKLIPVISGDNNNSGYTIASGEYFEANGALYQATGSIPTGYPWSSSAQAVSGTAVNALNGNVATIDSKIDATANRFYIQVGTLADLNTYFSNDPNTRRRSTIWMGTTVTNALIGSSSNSIAIVAKADDSVADMLVFSLGAEKIAIVRYNFSTSTVTKVKTATLS